MRVDPRWLALPLLIAVCAARTGDWQTPCGRACLLRIANSYHAAMAAVARADSSLASHRPVDNP
jgi:hypothetical protein